MCMISLTANFISLKCVQYLMENCLLTLCLPLQGLSIIPMQILLNSKVSFYLCKPIFFSMLSQENETFRERNTFTKCPQLKDYNETRDWAAWVNVHLLQGLSIQLSKQPLSGSSSYPCASTVSMVRAWGTTWGTTWMTIG